MEVKEIARALNFISSYQFWRMSLLWTLSLFVSYFTLFFDHTLRRNNFKVTPLSSSQRPLCIITGATSGLGAAAALALSKAGFFVILVGRSGHLLSKTMAEIRKLDQNAEVEAFEVDLSSFASIMKFKDTLQQWIFRMSMHSSVQLLVNNAGILATSYRATSDGFDEMLMTNYMSAFTLSKVLLPLLLASPVPSRIVNVSSFTHRSVTDIQVDKGFICGKSLANCRKYPCAQIYEYSKLFILLFSYELHRQISIMDKASQLSINIADPGAVKTNIMREIPSCVSQIAFSALKLLGLLQYPEAGITSILDASLAPPGTSGMYFFGGNGRTLNSSPLSYDARLAERLWRTSCDLFSELENTPNLSSACN